METNVDKLYFKTFSERLTQEEIHYVLDCLKNPDEEELYYLLEILGKEGMREYKPEYQMIVEPYLDYLEDYMISKMALEVLCDMWGQTEKYLPQVEAFIDGVEWDEDGSVQFKAIHVVGPYLNKRDKEPFYHRLLKKLFDIFNASQYPVKRGAAYFAMANAIGRDVEHMVDITYHHDHPDFFDKIDESKLDRSVLEEVSARLEGRYVSNNDPDLAVDLYELCRKAFSEEGLTEEEITFVLRRLNNHPKESLSQLLFCLAHVGKRAYKPEYQKIMESYLHYPFDPSISGYALEVFCSMWHQTEKYLPQVEAFIEGVEWNQYHLGTRRNAIEIAGEYLKGREDNPFYKRILKKLFDIFNTSGDLSREEAYFAMANAIGRGLEEGTNILYDEDHPDDLYSAFDIDERKLDKTIIEEVKARLGMV